MTGSPTDRPQNPNEGTVVDLGDDLLESSAPAVESAPKPEASGVDAVEDQLKSATILLNEGFTEDAKRVLRKILIDDPHHVPARKKLDEIHELELKQIFNEAPARPRPRRGPQAQYFSSDQVLRKLDEDLGLGLGLELSLLREDEALERFAHDLERELADVSPRDRLDIGIGFLEMGLYGVAIPQFRAAARSEGHLLAASALLSYALILWGRPFEATETLEPLLSDSEIPEPEKLELCYLMGRANEELGKSGAAAQWYLRVQETDPHYRDVPERLRRKRC
jgi:tetratricopeptide (TPR) repeat protein